MVRDWELVRKILTVLEARDTTHGALSPDVIEGYDTSVVSYHFSIMQEAGLIDAKCLKSSNAQMFCVASQLTWNGHEFLDKVRSETVWTKVKNTVESKGLDLSFEVIKAVASKVMENLLS